MQLSSSLSSVPTFETVSSSYFQSAIRNLNASFNIPTVVKLKKKRKDNKEKDGKSKKNPVISMQDLKTIFSQVRTSTSTPIHGAAIFYSQSFRCSRRSFITSTIISYKQFTDVWKSGTTNKQLLTSFSAWYDHLSTVLAFNHSSKSCTDGFL